MSDFTRAAAGMSTDALADGDGDDALGLGDALVTDADGLVVVGGVSSDWHPASTPATVTSPASVTAAGRLTRPDGIPIVRRSMRPFPAAPRRPARKTLAKPSDFASRVSTGSDSPGRGPPQPGAGSQGHGSSGSVSAPTTKPPRRITRGGRLSPVHLPAPALPNGLRLLRGYSGRHLPADVLAGLLVAALAIPQSLGYAVVAGVPVQVGLYTLPPALLAYALFGTSRLLFVGPVSTVSVLSGSIVRALAGGDTDLAVQLTSVLAITAGVVLVAVGLLRLGWVAQFLSEPIVTGFVAGLVVLIVIGEIPGLAGLSTPTGGIFERVAVLLRDSGDFHGLTLVVGLTSLAVLFVGSRLAPRVPWSLIVLVAGIVLSTRLDLAAKGVRVVGDVPTGIPIPSIPIVDISLWSGIVTGGVAIAAVGIAEGLAAVRTFAPSGAVDPNTDNQEFVAHGAADLASGLFGGMGVGGSLSKTAANARAGAHTQMSGVAAAIVVLGFVVFAAGLLANLPRTVLAAIVIHAVWGLVSVSSFRRYAAVRRNDFLAAVVAFLGVLVLGPLNGLLVAIGQSLLGLVYRSLQVEVDEMGRVDGREGCLGVGGQRPVTPHLPRRHRAAPGRTAVLGERELRGAAHRDDGGGAPPPARRGARPRGDQPDGHHHRRAPPTDDAAPAPPGHRPVPGARLRQRAGCADPLRLPGRARPRTRVALDRRRGQGGPLGAAARRW